MTQPANNTTQRQPDGKAASLAAWANQHKHSIYQFIYSRVKDKYVADEIFSDVCMALINIPKPLAQSAGSGDGFFNSVMQLVQKRVNEVMKTSRLK